MFRIWNCYYAMVLALPLLLLDEAYIWPCYFSMRPNSHGPGYTTGTSLCVQTATILLLFYVHPDV